MQRVLLLDELGEKFGAVHEYYNLRTPIDAIKLLCINHPGFQKELLESGERGIGYRVVQAGTDFELEDMLLPFGSNDLIIAPVIGGSSFWKLLSGAALFGLAIVTGGWGALTAGGFTGASIAAGNAAISTGALATAIAISGNVGALLALSGVAQMLSPQPEGPLNVIGSASQSGDRGPGSSIRGMDGSQSYAYRGPVNTVGAGAVIPLVFGQCIVGSHTVTASVEVTDESDPLNEWIGSPGVQTMRVNGLEIADTFADTFALGGASNQGPGIGVQYKTWTDSLVSSSVHDHGEVWLRTVGGDDTGSAAVPLDFSDYANEFNLYHISHVRGERPGGDRGRWDSRYFQMAFLLDNGLYDRAGGTATDTTKVDGFITFAVIIQQSGIVVGNTQFTVQGRLEPSQEYRWATQFGFAKIEGEDGYEVYVRLIDFRCDTAVNTLRIDYLGYRFLGT